MASTLDCVYTPDSMIDPIDDGASRGHEIVIAIAMPLGGSFVTLRRLKMGRSLDSVADQSLSDFYHFDSHLLSLPHPHHNSPHSYPNHELT